MKIVISLFFLLLPLMQSCGFVYKQHLTGNYYLIAVDTKDDMDVCYHRQTDDALYIGITGASVYAVGYDDDFILVKAYRALRDSMGISLQRYDKNTTEYYIIPVNNTQEAWEAQENKFVAFSKKDFEVKRKELGVSDDITFKRL
ncbi:DUF3997 domain-containing protein [Parabacteroides distasonis]|uniref:DUF3997 domain-containing protein n=1 Tax=Parabacteroides distasonis TaxID=823 RepID=UPI00189C3F18|nr:DUF3997 domain-containing protein [Parabacteroides distasonis]MDB8994748.1 DUF3997 domain-containing protein [Parabacteroides distasonis]MDB9069670.1 DUF3997 domain-containing protein [Parabacteroides distasonis]